MIKEIYLVHHSHTDLGYTDHQSIVIENHADFLRDVLRFCTETDHFDTDSKFRWTCETFWMVKNFISKYPGKIQEFIKRIKEGRIEITALYLNLTELYDLEMLIRSLEIARQFSEKYDIEIDTAVNCDINGLPWNLPQLLSSNNVRFLLTASNEIRGFAPEVSRPFYWESPGGSKILTWNAGRHGWYTEGVHLGFPEGKSFLKDKLHKYLKTVEKDYPYEELCIQLAQDNYPPNRSICELVSAWNQNEESPRIIISTPRHFFNRIRNKYANIPVYSGAWPDWWADGNGSCAYETALCRRMSKKMIENEALIALQKPKKGCLEKSLSIWDNLFYFGEHTFGSNSSVSNPSSLQARAQKNTKFSYVYQAAIDSDNLHHKLKTASGKNEQAQPQDQVINYKFRQNETIKIENNYYMIIIEPKTGAVKTLLDKEMNVELTDASSDFFLNQYIYENISSSRGREAIWKEKSTTEPYWVAFRKCSGARFKRYSTILVSGELEITRTTKKLVLRQKGKGCKAISSSIILYENEKRVDFVNYIDKNETQIPEAVYYSFPFRQNNPEIRICAPGQFVFEPEKEQLPGTCKDYFSIGDWIMVNDSKQSVILVSPDIPLIQIGKITTGKWLKHLDCKNGTLFSYVLNNYWHTNFPAFQSGKLEFSYTVTSWCGKATNSQASEFALKITNPDFLVLMNKYFYWDSNNIIPIAINRHSNGKDIILRFREADGKRSKVTFSIIDERLSSHYEIINEDSCSASANNTVIHFKPYEIKEVYLKCRKSYRNPA
ncbi:MAG: glycoside hydrolase family 38 C-terminal domain-containing protein [Victivallaceae bacterium]|nr:glycoside hydrolase family 38 C-terminal domain-containing protein [Victivallaceae bacterium]